MKKAGRIAGRVGVQERESVQKKKGLWVLHVSLGTKEGGKE